MTYPDCLSDKNKFHFMWQLGPRGEGEGKGGGGGKRGGGQGEGAGTIHGSFSSQKSDDDF